MQRGCLHCNGTDSWEGKRHILPDIIVMGKCERPLEVWSLCLLYVLLMPLIHCIRAFSDNMVTHKYVTACKNLSAQKKMCHNFFSEESRCHLILESDHHPWATTSLRIFCGAKRLTVLSFYSYHPREETSPPVISKTSW